MRTVLIAAVALFATVVPAQTPPTPGHLFIAMSGIGAGPVAGVSGEARLPIRTRDAGLTDGVLQLRASGTRGSMRAVHFVVRNAAAGRRYEAGPDAQMSFTVASGNTYLAEPGRGWVQVNEVDAHRAVGTFEATLSNARTPLIVRGDFEARY